MALPRAITRPDPLVVAGVAAVNLIVLAGFLLRFSDGGLRLDVYQIDLDVYRIGARTWLDGSDLYGPLPATRFGIGLPFTYPPFAAVLLAPLTLIPLEGAGILLTVLGAVALGIVLAVVIGSLEPGSSRFLMAGAVLPAALLIEPVRTTLNFGQINLLLMVLVVLDLLIDTPRWPRGALIGLAAAIKLTPAVFVLFFLLRKDNRAAVTAVSSFLAGTATGFLLAWDASARFWSTTLFDTGRIGAVHYSGNQSMLAVLARFGVDPPIRSAIWLIGAAVVLYLAAFGMRRAFAAGLPALAMALNALAALVISPVSWSHHWVWLVVVLLVFAHLWRRARVPLLVALGGLVLFTIAPQSWFPRTANLEFQWGLGQQLLGNAYLYFAVLVLIMATRLRLDPQRDAHHVVLPAGRQRQAGARGGPGERQLAGQAPGDQLPVPGRGGDGGQLADHGGAQPPALPAVLDQEGDLRLLRADRADELGQSDHL
jgi:alpha-1,2-mannosyltransferase